MSFREWKERIRDILDAIVEIQVFTHEMDFTHFQNDALTIRAVELNFIIIGEATNNIPDEVQEAYPEIPRHYMRAIRNRIVHMYFQVESSVLWDTIQNDLPPLKVALEKLITDVEK
jgi:uncharacterized protein with HEPN domain